MKNTVPTISAVACCLLFSFTTAAQTSKDLDYVVFTNLTIGQLADLRANFSDSDDMQRRFDSLLFAYVSGARDANAKSVAARKGQRADGSFDTAFAEAVEKCLQKPHPRDLMDELYSSLDQSGYRNQDFSTWLQTKIANKDC